MAERKFWLRADQIRPLIPNRGGCIASDRITVEGRLVGYMYRGKPVNKLDNGWRFLAGDESPEYMADTSRHTVYDVNTIANYDTAIIPAVGLADRVGVRSGLGHVRVHPRPAGR